MDSPAEPLRVDDLTWAALLGRWLDFARASIALPQDAHGRRWKSSVAPIITLQAVSFALGQLNDLPEDERALGLDRAEILLRRESGALNREWGGEPMPHSLLDLMADASAALRAATVGCGVEFLVHDAAEMRCGSDQCRVVPEYRHAIGGPGAERFAGEIHLARPGTLLIDGEPMGFAIGATPRSWWRERVNAAQAAQQSLPDLMNLLAPVRVRYTMTPRQVYRQMDRQGRLSADVAARWTDDPLPGQPLLQIVTRPGAAQVPMDHTDRWIAQQQSAWPEEGLRFEDQAGSAPEDA